MKSWSRKTIRLNWSHQFSNGWLLASYWNFLIFYGVTFKITIKIISPSCLGLWRQLHERECVMVLLHGKISCEYQTQLRLWYSNFWLERSPLKASSHTCFVAFLLFCCGVVNLWVKGNEDLYMNVHSSITTKMWKPSKCQSSNEWIN